MRESRKILTGLVIAGLLFSGVCLAEVETNNPYGEESLIAQPRAGQMHDRVTITIDLKTEAKSEASSDTSKESSVSWSFANLFRIGKDQDGDIIAKPFADVRKPTLDVDTEREQKGDGETETKNTIRAEISGEVVDVRPNKHLVVEARRSITINNETRTVLFTGRIDPRDLTAENTIDMKYVIDPCLKLQGKGDISDAVRRGWLAKFFDTVSPF
ncbi:MAG: flagellar basal body L-ring protein FlgH [Planctomycetes bacterium]|nr:flagellar basal body L-ring protein FlgH [Planctomycetota bacterium]